MAFGPIAFLSPPLSVVELGTVNTLRVSDVRDFRAPRLVAHFRAFLQVGFPTNEPIIFTGCSEPLRFRAAYFAAPDSFSFPRSRALLGSLRGLAVLANFEMLREAAWAGYLAKPPS